MPNSKDKPARRPQSRPQPQQQPQQQLDEWNALKVDLDRNKGVYAALLGGKKKAPDPEVERFRMECYQVVWHKPDLLKANRDSLLLAFAEAAVVRLSINPTAKEGYVEVRSGVARFATQYQGLVKLMHRGADIDYLFTDVVRQGDAFRQIGGSDPRLEHIAAELGHEPDNYDSDESILAVYAVVKTMGSSRAVHEVARRSEILKARSLSKGKGGKPPSPAWAAWFSRMAKKLPLRRLANIIPGADEARMALGVEDAQARGEAVTFDRVSQAFDPVASPRLTSPQQPDELRALMDASGPAVDPEVEQP
jgi:recombinational DNA repair protein RecT